MSPRYLVLLSLLTLSAPSAADRLLPGRVLHVLDGDSLIIDVRGGQYRVELAGVDAPELNQPWGQAARDWLEQALAGRFVVVRSSDFSPDGQIHGRLLFKNRDPGTDLLYQGLAWCAPQPDSKAVTESREYLDAQKDARAARRGLWSDAGPVPPWEWRRQRPGSLGE